MLQHPPPSHPIQSYTYIKIRKYNPYFPGYIVGGPKFSNKMFHVLKGIDLNKTIKKIT